MPLDPELLKILRCPKCKGDLVLEEEETGFLCKACRLRFPVVDGIPDFLLSDARPLND